jgi:5'-nucleotidase/UDP-sugar diphosphatase
MARALPAAGTRKGLDLIVSGHSDRYVCMLRENVRNDAHVPGQPCTPDRQNGTWIVHALEWGKYVGRADLEVRGTEVQLLKYELMPVNLMRRAPDRTLSTYTAPIAEDPALRAFLEPYQARGTEATAQVVGETVGLFDGDRNRVRLGPVSLGRLIAQAMADKTGADLAVMNSGGIRASLPEGRVTYRDLLHAQPWSNQLVVVRLRGAELLDWLKVAAAMKRTAGGFPQTFGVQMRIEGGVLKEARVRGQPVDAQREYRMVVNEFVALGGDGYPALAAHPGAVNTGFVDVQVLRDYIAARSPIKAADYTPQPDDVQRQ